MLISVISDTFPQIPNPPAWRGDEVLDSGALGRDRALHRALPGFRAHLQRRLLPVPGPHQPLPGHAGTVVLILELMITVIIILILCSTAWPNRLSGQFFS